MSALLLAILATYHPPVVVLAVQDTGYLVEHGCNHMAEHWHQEDGQCHRDSDDSVIQILEVPDVHL